MANTNKILVPDTIKGLIFDMDGTLLNSTPVHYNAWLEACKPFKVHFDYDYFITLTGRPVVELSKDLIERFNMPVEPMDLVNTKEQFVENNLSNIQLIKPVFNVVKHFQGKLPMAVGTGASRKRANHLLSESGIIERFDAIVTSDDVYKYKPEPDTFLKAAELIGIAPADCLVFEDGQLGIEAAKAAGMSVIDVKPFYE